MKKTSSTRCGVLLAGGYNSRLFPATLAAPKALLPVYDKPLIYYSLSALMLAGIREVAVVTTPQSAAAFKHLFGDGARLGLQVHHAVQEQPLGIAHGLLAAREHIAGKNCALALGDNIFYGGGLGKNLHAAAARKSGATVFACRVGDPSRFGVAAFSPSGKLLRIVEKPKIPPSDYAVTGLYFYDRAVTKMAGDLKPSARGELEVTDLNSAYLKRGQLRAEVFGRGVAWFDTGTPESLAAAADFVRAIQRRQGAMIACPEEIAHTQGWLSNSDLRAAARAHKNTPYGEYLAMLAKPPPRA